MDLGIVEQCFQQPVRCLQRRRSVLARLRRQAEGSVSFRSLQVTRIDPEEIGGSQRRSCQSDDRRPIRSDAERPRRVAAEGDAQPDAG